MLLRHLFWLTVTHQEPWACQLCLLLRSLQESRVTSNPGKLVAQGYEICMQLVWQLQLQEQHSAGNTVTLQHVCTLRMFAIKPKFQALNRCACEIWEAPQDTYPDNVWSEESLPLHLLS